MSQSTDLLWPQHTAAPEQTADAQNAAGSTTSPDNGTAGTTDEHTLLRYIRQRRRQSDAGRDLRNHQHRGGYGKPAGQPDSLPAATAPETVPSMSYDNAKPYFESGALLIDLPRRRPIWKITRMKRSICHSPSLGMRFRRWLIPGKPCSSSLPTHKAVPLSRKFSGDWAIPGYMN